LWGTKYKNRTGLGFFTTEPMIGSRHGWGRLRQNSKIGALVSRLACWQKVFNCPTGTADRKEAEKQLATVEIMVTTNREGKLNEAVYRSLTGQAVQRVALKPAVEDYLARKVGAVSKGTLDV
jgi:hypothetical protein